MIDDPFADFFRPGLCTSSSWHICNRKRTEPGVNQVLSLSKCKMDSIFWLDCIYLHLIWLASCAQILSWDPGHLEALSIVWFRKPKLFLRNSRYLVCRDGRLALYVTHCAGIWLPDSCDFHWQCTTEVKNTLLLSLASLSTIKVDWSMHLWPAGRRCLHL